MATVAFTKSDTYEEITVNGTVADAEPFNVMYTRGVVIVPDSITVMYTRVNGEPWETSRITISGFRKLKSGKVSDSRHNSNHRFRSDFDKLPSWVGEFVADNMPTVSEGQQS